MRTYLRKLLVVATLIAINFHVLTTHAQGTVFTYQGRLLDGGSPANGFYDMQFVLYHSSNAVSQAGGPIYFYSLPVSNGLFTVPLNFGTAPFSGASGGNNWLDISVRVPGGDPTFTTLVPRTQLTAAPYAVTANNLAPGTNANAVTFNNSQDTFNGTFTGSVNGNGSGITSLNATNISAGTLSDSRLSANVPLLNASQTFTGAINTFGDITMNTSAYHHLTLTGGNSQGFLYGSYAALGDGIHLGYNYYADAAGTGHIINSGGGTSRISMGYGSIALLTGYVNGTPYNGLTISGPGVPVSITSSGMAIGLNGNQNAQAAQAALDCWYNIIIRGNGYWSIGVTSGGYFGFWPNGASAAPAYIDTSGNYHQSSDRRMKRNIASIDRALDRLLQLRPVSYNYSTNTTTCLGLIAQEVEPLFPQLVGSETNGTKDLVYTGLIPVTIRSVQELNDKLETQLKQKETEIQDLKQSNEHLAAQLSELQAAVKALQKNQN